MNKLLLVVMACFFIVGCHSIHHINGKKSSIFKSTIKKSDSPVIIKRDCIYKCEQIYKACQKQCHNSCRKCQKEADKQAWKSYRSYYNKIKVEGTYRPRDWLSFRDPLQCRKVTCSCPADLNVCIQQCGGIIRKVLRATPYCQ